MDILLEINESLNNTVLSFQCDFTTPLTPETPLSAGIVSSSTPGNAFCPDAMAITTTTSESMFFGSNFENDKNFDLQNTVDTKPLSLDLQTVEPFDSTQISNLQELFNTPIEALHAPPTPPMSDDGKEVINVYPNSSYENLFIDHSTPPPGYTIHDPMMPQYDQQQCNMMSQQLTSYYPLQTSVATPFLTPMKEEHDPTLFSSCARQRKQPAKRCSVGRPLKIDPNDVNLSHADKTRKHKRREQNRRAASTCRDKKKKQQDYLHEKYIHMDEDNKHLKQQVLQLEQEKLKLQRDLEQHKKICPHMMMQNSAYTTYTTPTGTPIGTTSTCTTPTEPHLNPANDQQFLTH